MISIAMATYNGEKYLKAQLDSVLSQTYTDFELVICDDCSNDKTWEILESYSDPRIKLYKNEINLGFKCNFQKAVTYCKGNFIAFCDQDDIWTENHLEFLLKHIENNDLICANAKLIDSEGKDLNITTKNCLGDFSFTSDNSMLFKKLLHGNFVQGTACMITKKLADQIFPIPSTIDFHDWWAASVACLNNGCAYFDEIILFYRQHGNNVTTNKKIRFLDSINDAIKKRKLKLTEYRKKADYAEEILKLCKSGKEIKSASEAKNYYSNLYNRKYFSAIKYFNSNYHDIYWVHKPSKKLFLLRFCKVFLFHI